MTQTVGSIEYKVVTGTVAGIVAFNAAVEAQINNGYAVLDIGPQSDGTNIWQIMFKGSAESYIAEYPITTATVGAAGLGSFQFAAADLFPAQDFHPGYKFTITGSTGNDDVWTVKNGAGATWAGGFVTVPVKEAVTDNTADGSIIAYAASVGP